MTNAQEKGSGSKVKSLFPILTWLSHYNWKDIRFDLIAGIVVAGLIIPESMGIADEDKNIKSCLNDPDVSTPDTKENCDL